MDGLPIALFDAAILGALSEDLGVGGDITTNATIPSGEQATANLVVREPGRVIGLDIAARVFQLLDPGCKFLSFVADGDAVQASIVLATITGEARALLTGERTALNYMTHLSGIATATASFVAAVEGTGARIVCTRKTTPGLRSLEKYAVRMGGGQNHRFALDQSVLIKDNHIAYTGSISEAVDRVRSRVGHTVFVEVEVDTLAQLEQALRCRIDAVLLDNMSVATLRDAVEMVDGRVVTEASGGVRLETVREIAETGVNMISTGWITASAPSLDIALDWPT